jgi:phage shock protein E
MRPWLLALLGFAFALVAFRWLMRRGRISAVDARRLVEGGALLLDVRTPSEFAAGHVEGAKNVAVQQLEGALDALGPRDRPVVVYCQSGMRSRLAVALLRRAGFTAVHDLGPGSVWR